MMFWLKFLAFLLAHFVRFNLGETMQVAFLDLEAQKRLTFQ